MSSRSALSVLTRRSSGARLASAAPSAARSSPNDARKIRIEPIRIVALRHAPARRRACRPSSAVVSASVSGAGAKRAPLHSASIAATSSPRSRRSMPISTARGLCLAHEPGRRGLAAQRVIDEAGNGGAIAGAGKAMREAPILERIGRRTPPRFDVGKNLDGGGKSGRRRHAARARRAVTYFILRLMAAARWRGRASRAGARACADSCIASRQIADMNALRALCRRARFSACGATDRRRARRDRA